MALEWDGQERAGQEWERPEREGQDSPAAGGLSVEAAVRSALDCYRNALSATDEAEAGAWIRAGHWFERILAGGEGTATLLQEMAATEITLPDFAERRAWPREPASDGALLSLGRTLFITRLHDLCAGGATVDTPAALDADIGTDLTLIAPDRGINRPARVARVAPDRLHLRFTTALSPGEMRAAGLAPAGSGMVETG
ncbi:MAG: hypothetical protein RLY86_2652 [Pseudomonadota bacterium]|jgi:hypothetical protein